MFESNRLARLTVGIALVTQACGDDAGGSTAEPAGSPAVLSAYLGIEDANALQAVGLGNVTGCQQAAGDEGMPVVVSSPVDAATLAPDRFLVRTVSGATHAPSCATLAPADEPDELRTILLAGPLGSAEDPPEEVEIVGEVLAFDGKSYRGAVSPRITRFDGGGPGLVYALSGPAGPLCAAQGSETEVQLAFEGGVTQSDDAEFDAAALPAFHLIDAAGGDRAPTDFDDLEDGDNYLVLCVPAGFEPTTVRVDAQTVYDPTNNPNASALEVTIEDS